MKTISLCMIVRNEQDVIARCLESAADIADEIIIVDTGSDDRTKEFCSLYTDKIYDFAWTDDFAAARNESYSHATMDYILWLDADDVIEPDDREKFLALKNTLTDEDIIYCRYHVAFDEDGKPVYSFFRERLTKRETGFVWEGFVHECIEPRGKLLYSDAAVCHRKLRAAEPGRNLRIYRKTLASGKELSPRHLFYFARELYYNKLYEEAAENFRRFLGDGKGWYVNCIDACSMLAECCLRTDREDEALSALFESFRYDRPHAEICCQIGERFTAAQKYDTAVYWYETALKCKPHPENGGFVVSDCYDIVPLLQLCVCYDRLGQYDKAAEFNRFAAAVRPNHPAVLANLEYFSKRK